MLKNEIFKTQKYFFFICSISNVNITVGISVFALFKCTETAYTIIIMEKDSTVLMHKSTFSLGLNYNDISIVLYDKKYFGDL
jgi:hypothetical protein